MDKLELNKTFTNPNTTVVRCEVTGSTDEKRLQIINTIKNNFDNGNKPQAVTFAVNGAHSPSALERQTLAILIEYTDGHIELYDQHNLSINRDQREMEVIDVIGCLVQLGIGSRIYYCAKRLHPNVFSQPPLVTAAIIKQTNVRQLFPNWIEFAAVNMESQQIPDKSIYQEEDWERLAEMSTKVLNSVNVVDLTEFVAQLSTERTVSVGYVGRRCNEWIFILKREEDAIVCFVDESCIVFAYNSIIKSCKTNTYGSFINDTVKSSAAERLILVNKKHPETMQPLEVTHDWLFRRISELGTM